MPHVEGSLMKTSSLLALLLTALVSADSWAQSTPRTVTTTRIGTMFPGGDTTAWDISDKGEVAGTGRDGFRDGRSFPFVWTEAAGFQALSGIPSDAYVIGSNDAGTIIGLYNAGAQYSGFSWDPAHGFRAAEGFVGYAINNDGRIAGLCQRGIYADACTSDGDVPSPLPIPAGAVTSYLRGINASGDVVGLRQDPDGTPHNFFWSAARGTVDYPTTLPFVALNDQGEILAENGAGTGQIWRDGQLLRRVPSRTVTLLSINNRGWAVGVDFARSHGVVWLPSGELIDLPPLPGHVMSQAVGLNDRGQVVGVSSAGANLPFEAVLWNIQTPGATLRIDTPNSFSRWGIDTRQRLAWTYGGNAPAFLVEINREGGDMWEFLATVPNKPGPSQNFYWPVTGPASAHARLRVTAVGDDGATDENDADISIAPASISVVLPNRATTIQIGTQQTIFFTHNLGAEKPVRIDVSGDHGTSWQTVAASTLTKGADTSSFRWTVGLLPTTQAQIRITSLDGSGAVAVSATFTVTGGAAGALAGTSDAEDR